MFTLLLIFLGTLAVITIISVAISNRAGSKMLGKEAFAKREARMQMLRQMQELGQRIQLNPDDPNITTMRTQFDALNTECKKQANESLSETKNALQPVMKMNYVVAGLTGIFALGAIGYLSYIAPIGTIRWIYLGFGVFIVIMLIYGALGMIRAKRAWDFATKDRG